MKQLTDQSWYAHRPGEMPSLELSMLSPCCAAFRQKDDDPRELAFTCAFCGTAWRHRDAIPLFPAIPRAAAGPSYERRLGGVLRYIDERLKMHRDNLGLWVSGYLNPTEPDADERERVKARLRAAIEEGERIRQIVLAATG